ncbi:MAG: hypothetical protein LBM75_03630 [Myxococcales bacterium]|nr:hypothetical protein [Myxococcales bacterium]
MVFIPKHLKKALYVELRKRLGENFWEIEEGHSILDLLYILIKDLSLHYPIAPLVHETPVFVASRFTSVWKFPPRASTDIPRPSRRKGPNEGISPKTQPKNSGSKVVGYIKEKNAVYVALKLGERKRNYKGENFWARGHCVSTVD